MKVKLVNFHETSRLGELRSGETFTINGQLLIKVNVASNAGLQVRYRESKVFDFGPIDKHCICVDLRTGYPVVIDQNTEVVVVNGTFVEDYPIMEE